MFVLTTIKDTIKISPDLLGEPIEAVLTNEINRRFANRVILDVGLVICLHKINKIGESAIYSGDGSIHTKCTCQVVVFRPVIGEIICGNLKSSSKEGLHVSLGFFDSISIPPEQLPEPSSFNEKDQTWIWKFVDEQGQHDLALEVGETIRFRVHKDIFTDVSPRGPAGLIASATVAPSGTTASGTNVSVINQTTNDPYTIVGSISESGLGMATWWK